MKSLFSPSTRSTNSEHWLFYYYRREFVCVRIAAVLCGLLAAWLVIWAAIAFIMWVYMQMRGSIKGYPTALFWVTPEELPLFYCLRTVNAVVLILLVSELWKFNFLAWLITLTLSGYGALFYWNNWPSYKGINWPFWICFPVFLLLFSSVAMFSRRALDGRSSARKN